MKKYLLLVLLTFIGITQYGFDNLLAKDEKESINPKIVALVASYDDCEKCGPGLFWNDFMQRCEKIPGFVPKEDKRDKGHNLLPYGAQDINKSPEDVVKHNLESVSNEDDEDTTPSEEEDENTTPSEETDEDFEDSGW